MREEVGSLNNRIQELESQNKALTSMLVHQLRDSPSYSDNTDLIPSRHLALEDSNKKSDEDNTSADASPTNLMKTSLTFKHCNSFNSEILDRLSYDSQNECLVNGNDKIVSNVHNHLSADSDILGTFSCLFCF